jgi:CubicO group peptidase (beta-lactamase class C family)
MKALQTENSAAEVIEKLIENIPGLMARANVPGMSVAMVRNAQIYWQQAFGVTSTATQEKVTDQTLFEAASLSKTVFAYALLKLANNHLIELDSPLAEYLPEPYIDNEPFLELITMRHVLNHTCGFPNWRPKGKPLKVHFTPGQRFSYSGEGFMYLQSVLAAVTRQDPADYLRTEFLEPFGMEHSWYSIAGLEGSSIAVGHDKKGKPAEKNVWPEMYAAASLHSTATDFARFICAILKPDLSQPLHLSPEMTKEMLTPQVAVNDDPPWAFGWPKRRIRTSEKLSWGLGWGLEHTSAGLSFWHWGDNGKFRAFTLGYPDLGTGIIFLSNGQNGQNIISQLLLSVFGGEFPGLMWLENPNAI